MRRSRVAVAQMAPILGDVEKNLALHEKAAREAISQSVNLLVFPELSLTGYFLKDQVTSVALTEQAPALDVLRNLSHRVAMVVGFVEEAPGHRFHNAAAYLEGGEIRHIHRKVYLPTYGIFDEQRYLAAGARIQAFDTALGRMAILICEDLWHPATAGIAAWDGAEIILCPSASPGRGLGQAEPFQNASTWERVIRAYGDLFACFVVYANRVGYEDGACFWGGSEVVGPTGQALAKAGYLEEELLVVEVEGGALRRARVANPLLRDERLELTLQEVQRILRARGGDPG
ncbi:MAG: carbon-nitrogen hydrolase [candidate division NC10 bacterium]|nr:carbon-nitrogen hydrolase [candidate division NC10 bacterium]MBI2116449.1 carbon-nitrogen hydrolase [candidate division NC10 bacterium]MBI2564334.1 carbon-nitrogen hydrolase [candidate division NC10 bacterium]